MFECPSCGNPCHPDYLDYDAFGAGCPHCGAQITTQEMKEAQDNGN